MKLWGTRPTGSPATPEKPWPIKQFARTVGTSTNTVNNWLKGKYHPAEAFYPAIEIALFGENSAFHVWRIDLTKAYRREGGSEPTFGRQSNFASNVTANPPRHFVGRETALAAIRAAMLPSRARLAITALHGLRGVGKTTLAVAFCRHSQAEYRAVWWIRAYADETIRADLIALGVRLGWVKSDDQEKSALAEVLNQLSRVSEPVLLVYDNALNARHIAKFLPSNTNAHIIITSNAPAWRSVADPISIDVWPTTVGSAYLIARTGRDQEILESKDLSDMLGGLPLALEQAGSYCEHLGISIAEYNRRLRANATRLLADPKYSAPEYYDGRTVIQTFELAIDTLDEATREILSYLSLFDADEIPLFLFTEAKDIFPPPVSHRLQRGELDIIVGELRSLALIERIEITDERVPAVKTDSVKLHRLVRQTASDRLPNREQKHKTIILLLALKQVFPKLLGVEFADIPKARRLERLTASILDLAQRLNIENTEFVYLCGSVSTYKKHGVGAYADALLWLQRGLAISERTVGSEHQNTVSLLGDIGLLLRDMGDFDQAKPALKRAMKLSEKVYGANTPNFATSLNNYAIVLKERDPAEAIPFFERAIKIREATLGEAHPHTAQAMNNLASMLRETKDFLGAINLHERALKIRERSAGADDLSTGISLLNLGLVYHDLRDFNAAHPYIQRAVSIFEKTLGREHPNTAIAYYSFGNLLRDEGRFDDAQPFLESALDIRKSAFGTAHKWTALSFESLGRLRQEQRDVAAAVPLFEQAVDARKKSSGEDHPDVATALFLLGGALVDAGEAKRAASCLERALIIRRIKSKAPEEVALCCGELGRALAACGEFTRARELLMEALKLSRTENAPPGSAVSRFHEALALIDSHNKAGRRVSRGAASSSSIAAGKSSKDS